MPPPQRHPLIHARFEQLREGQVLSITSDHEPRPLRAEFERRYPGAFAWQQRCVGPGHWEASIVKRSRDAEVAATAIDVRSWAGFGDLDAEALATLIGSARSVALRRNRAAVEQGVVWPYVGVVERGLIQAVLVAPDGREIAMYDVLAGDAFGVIALLDGGASPLRFVARADGTRVVLLGKSAVVAAMRECSGLAQSIAAAAAQRLRSVVERFSAHASQPISARVAGALLTYASPQLGMVEAPPGLQRMRQVELAVAAGTGRDIVYRAIAELEEAGAIKRAAGKITHLDREKLLAAAAELKY